MRIVTWNCQMGLHKKAEALLSLKPDVAVVPECSEKSSLTFREHGYESRWIGTNPHKGLAVFTRSEWKVRALPSPPQQWILPIKVFAPIPFIVIGIWACSSGHKKADNYIGRVYKALLANEKWFGKTPIILAGDLNSNSIWDAQRRTGNHADVVKILAGHHMLSAYHEHFAEAHGSESSATHFLYRHAHRPFHLDYVFIPKAWATGMSVDIGKHKRWSKLSDHVPITVDLPNLLNEH